MSVFKGTAAIVELTASRSFDPKTGWVTVRKFKGTPTAIADQRTALLYDGCKLTHEPPDDGGWEGLTATYAWDVLDPNGENPTEPISDRWSLQGNMLEKSLWEMPKVVAELETLIDGTFTAGSPAVSVTLTKSQQIAFLRRYIRALVEGEYKIDSPVDGNPINISEADLLSVLGYGGLSTTVFQGLFKALAKGVESYPVSQYVLRRVLTIGPFCALRPSYTNVGKVFSTSALSTAESIPSTLMFEMPAGYWLKQTPTCDDDGPGKWVINQEWWHADYYDPFIYEVAT